MRDVQHVGRRLQRRHPAPGAARRRGADRQAELGQLRRWARRRGWDRIRLVSSFGNTFNRDFAFENEQGGQEPGLSIFSRLPDGAIHHRYSIGAEFADGSMRGIDLYAPVWQLLDLLPAGRGDWYPAHHHMLAAVHTAAD